MAKRKNITCVKYNDSDRYGWVSHSTAGKLIDAGHAVEWNPRTSEPEKQTYPNHIGGGWFELSNGEKVQGKEIANEQQNKL